MLGEGDICFEIYGMEHAKRNTNRKTMFVNYVT